MSDKTEKSSLSHMCQEYQDLFWSYRYISISTRSYTKKHAALEKCRKHRENCAVCQEASKKELEAS
jgi:hypothetical protein